LWKSITTFTFKSTENYNTETEQEVVCILSTMKAKRILIIDSYFEEKNLFSKKETKVQTKRKPSLFNAFQKGNSLILV
jgi:hypothetical protein